MKVDHKRGSNDLAFTVTEHKYSNFIINLQRYFGYKYNKGKLVKHKGRKFWTIPYLLYGRKKKVRSVYVRYKWKYKDPTTLRIKYFGWNQNISLFLPPPAITNRTLLPFITAELEEYMLKWLPPPLGSSIVQIHQIFIEFNYY